MTQNDRLLAIFSLRRPIIFWKPSLLNRARFELFLITDFSDRHFLLNHFLVVVLLVVTGSALKSVPHYQACNNLGGGTNFMHGFF